jgi:hypothetical protein
MLRIRPKTQYAFPLGFYSDNNQSRNLFEGLFSLIGACDTEIIKQAVVEELNDTIIKKLETGEKLTTEERLELENKIEECRREFESGRTDSAKADELARRQGKY